MQVLDPCTGDVLGVCGNASIAQAHQAVEAAATAFKSWKKLSDADHAKWLRKCAALHLSCTRLYMRRPEWRIPWFAHVNGMVRVRLQVCWPTS